MDKLSDYLIDKICSGEAILFLGAGAIKGAKSKDGFEPPDANQLRDILSDSFLGGAKKSCSLAQVAEFAKDDAGLQAVQSKIKELLEPIEPAEFHSLIAKFKWHSIVTTNYDLIIEKVYNKNSSSIQKLKPVIRDGDNIYEKLKIPENLIYLKLHGSITEVSDNKLPLILASEEYSKHKNNRTRIFNAFNEWARDFPVIFCGYNISDPNIQDILFDIGDRAISRPTYAVVRPGLDDIDKRYWSSRRFIPIQSSFEEFLKYLDTTIPKDKRLLGILKKQESYTFSKWIASHARPSNKLTQYFSTDLEHLYPGMPMKGVEAKEFYNGTSNDWGVFEAGLDIRRKVIDDILLESVVDEPNTIVHAVLVKGFAGSGKSVIVRRTAWEAAHDFEKFVIGIKDYSTIREDLLLELYSLINERIYIAIDNITGRIPEIIHLIEFCEREKIRITLFLSARTNEWNIYGEDLDPDINYEVEARNLSENEIEGLLDKLSQHKCLGELERLSRPEQVNAFHLTAERQLLVALHEATSGKPFEEIVYNEYLNIIPDEARILYLDICTFHRLGVPARAGLISRVSGINFEDFNAKFLKPLEHVVHVEKHPVFRDYTYRSRHQLIAEFVFQQALKNPNDKANQLIRIIKYLNVDFKTDEEAFSQILKGKYLAGIFSSKELAEQIFLAAEESNASLAHIKHQKAILELNHPNGDIYEALASIQKSEELSDGLSIPIIHTKSRILRRLANVSDKVIERDKNRRTAISLLEKVKDRAKSSHVRSALVQIYIDDIDDRLKRMGVATSDQLTDRVITDSIKECEKEIYEGLQRFPEDEHLLTSKSRLAEVLRDKPAAIAALERAYSANPGNGFIASRLAQQYSGDNKKATEILRKSISVNPLNPESHLQLAMIYIADDEVSNSDKIIEHLRRSFIDGDTNYGAQFWYARHNFLYGDRFLSNKICTHLGRVKLPSNIKHKVRGLVRNKDGKIIRYRGRIKSKQESFCFAFVESIKADVYFHFRAFNQDEWDVLHEGSDIEFDLGFTMRGAAGINAMLVGEKWDQQSII
ncbi:MAG: SIR2 family protein [Gammaproteobacteria bacterium]